MASGVGTGSGSARIASFDLDVVFRARLAIEVDYAQLPTIVAIGAILFTEGEIYPSYETPNL